MRRLAAYMGLTSTTKSIAQGTKSEKVAYLYGLFATVVSALIGITVYGSNDTSARLARVGYGIIGFVIPFVLLLAVGALVARWRRHR